MKHREAVEANEEGHTPISLEPWEFLLRGRIIPVWALYVSAVPESRYSWPMRRYLLHRQQGAELQAVAFELTRKKKNDDLGKIKDWLKVLVVAGSSLDGARPKANLIDEGRSFWIANPLQPMMITMLPPERNYCRTWPRTAGSPSPNPASCR